MERKKQEGPKKQGCPLCGCEKGRVWSRNSMAAKNCAKCGISLRIYQYGLENDRIREILSKKHEKPNKA